MKTQFASVESVSRQWHLVDAQDQILGRMATRIASVLRGKHKATYTPHVDTGDFIVVVNADKVKVSGAKASDKVYWTHSGYTGSEKGVSFEKQMEKNPTLVIEHAVRGMLPKGPLGRKMFKKLKIYSGANHPHVAQNPTNMSIG
ncbi:MAG: 50S ribosomal protein L13 [Myxococcales bacterium]|nr:50S ribosomal protein L13 [Myxococcales bacterium]USN51780.1 MAG: 50S ribosomal protein L13 [Myxococcales bacterium]